MKLQSKILLFLSFISGVILLAFLSFQYIGIQQRKLIHLENTKNQELVIDKVIQLNRIKYEQLLNDNSGWDDMVTFAAQPDTEWAKSNVDFFIYTFDLSVVQVYSKDLRLSYQSCDSGLVKSLVKFQPETLRKLFRDTAFVHFFVHIESELFEYFGASIVPADDADLRKTTPQGYLFIARKWDQAYLKEHEQSTGFTVELLPKRNDFIPDPEKIYYYRSLTDYKGQEIASVSFSKNDPLRADNATFIYLSILVTCMAVAALIIFLIFFNRIILVPLRQISATLDTRDPEHIENLRSQTDEFQRLKQLILRYFSQEDMLRNNNAELKEINSTKDKLFSIIAHDLKNPIGNILTISDLLNENIKNRDSENTPELIEMIGSQARETLGLLETLFDWAKSQTGQISFKPEMLNLNEILKQIIDMHSQAALLKEITIELKFTKLTTVYADPNMLKTILINLITNAVKFTRQGGIVRIWAEESSKGVTISVSDNGIGMNLKTKEGLFQIAISNTTAGTANEKGTGLGLIICNEFVCRHGGEIRVESIPDKGSTFSFNLPFNR